MAEEVWTVCRRIDDIEEYLHSVEFMQGTSEDYEQVLQELDQLLLEVVGLRGKIEAALIENSDDHDWKLAEDKLDRLENEFSRVRMRIKDLIYELNHR